MPKGKPKQKFGKQSLVDDQLDAYDYAEEDAEYQRWEETQVKEGKVVPKEEKPTTQTQPKPQSEPEEKSKPTEKSKPESFEEEKEPVLEQFDDWEAAMDALEAKICYDEEKKAAGRNAGLNLNALK